ncbi:MAG: hypothetical protein ACYCTW_07620, partial [Sulfuricella sp.]
MSVFLHAKPIGLFYADSTHDGGALNEQRYFEFQEAVPVRGAGLGPSVEEISDTRAISCSSP